MKNLLLARIPKNASVSTISFFANPQVKYYQRIVDEKEIINFAWTNTLYEPKIAREITLFTKTKKETKEVTKSNHFWNKFYAFAFVRNPYDRAVSSWKFGSWNKNWECSFEEYTLQLLELNEEGKLDMPFVGGNGLIHHSTKQYNYLYQKGKKHRVNHIGKVETYMQDMNFVLKENDLPTVDWLPHRNKTIKNEYKVYYNQNSKKNIEKIYEKDIETFKYLF